MDVWTLVGAVFASGGFWAFLTALIQRWQDRKSASAKLVRGIAHDRICYLGEKYIENGYITRDDYENLHDYLYVPYHALGGNGTAEKIMEEVKRLPIRKEKP